MVVLLIVWILMVSWTAHKSVLNPIKQQLQFYFSALDQQQFTMATEHNTMKLLAYMMYTVSKFVFNKTLSYTRGPAYTRIQALNFMRGGVHASDF